MTEKTTQRIAIIGGGIGGLTLALALRARGLNAQVYEQATQLSEIGAAVALSANATRELARLGLLDQLWLVSTEPSELIYRNWRTGDRVVSHNVHHDSAYQQRFGAPYFGIHRGDLQRILGAALAGEGLHLGHRLIDIADRNGTMALTFANGAEVEADLVVGADGVRSVVRRFVTEQPGGATYSGTSAFRGIVPTRHLPTLPDPQAIQFWMGPNAHLLHYAIGASGQDINYFAVVEGPEQWPNSGSTCEITPAEALAAFAGWHPAVTEMIAATEHRLRWGLFVAPYLLKWHRNGAVLLGDSAHAMLPHHGQGANTTIEDAIVLAELLAAPSDAGLEALLQRYQELRRARTRKIQSSAWRTNALLHLDDDDPTLAARDLRLAAFPERFGWIHDFDAVRSVNGPSG